MADIFTDTLKKLNDELGGNPIQKSLDEAAAGGQPKKEEVKTMVPAKSNDPLGGLTNEQLRKKLDDLNAQLIAKQKPIDTAKLMAMPEVIEGTKKAKEIGKALIDPYVGVAKDLKDYLSTILTGSENASQ